jgi:hypothetical protein
VQAYVDPVGIADVKDRSSMTVANGAVAVGYDSHFLEMGIGLGAQTVRVTAFDLTVGTGLTVAQVLRLGTRDGLNLHLRSSVVLFHSEFDFGGVVVTGQIPVSRGYWLMLAGGGGNVGYGFGEIGLRVLLNGNGGVGSTFLTATGGGAVVFRQDFDDSTDYGGAMAGFGYEWRF